MGDVLHRQRFAVVAEFGNDGAVDVVGCVDCGFVFSDSRLDQASIDAVYADHSKYADTSIYGDGSGVRDVAPEPPWDLDRLEDTARYLAGVLSGRRTRVLDVGCATGSLLRFLEREGFTAPVGIDPSPAAARIGREAHRVDTRAGSLFALPEDIGLFDVVVLAHVLEHIADVRSAVRSLSGLVRPGGTVYVEVPDASRYADHVHAPFQDFNTEHINHFSPASLRRALRNGGFEESQLARRTVMCGPGLSYPVVYGLWTKPIQELPAQSKRIYDQELVDGVRRYVEVSSEITRQIDDRLRESIDIGRPVILWGAGQLALRLLCDTVLRDARELTIVDTSPQKHGLHIGGIQVQAPQVVRSSDVPIVVASINSSRSIEESIRQDFGLRNPVVLLAG